MRIIHKPILFDAESRKAQFPHTFPRETPEEINHWFGQLSKIQSWCRGGDPIFAQLSTEGKRFWVAVFHLTRRGTLLGFVHKAELGALPANLPQGTVVAFQQRHILARSHWPLQIDAYLLLNGMSLVP